MTSVRRTVGAAIVGVVLASLVWVAPAEARGRAPLTTITCGQRITTSIRVANDLTCAGLILTAAGRGVTVDLNGRTLRSTALGPPCASFPPPTFPPSCTIDIGEGATLTNGKLRGAQVGSRGGQITDVQATNSSFHLAVAGLHRSQLMDGTVHFWGGSQITRNRLVRTPLVTDNAFRGSCCFTIADNTLRDSVVQWPGATASIAVVGSVAFPQDISGEIVRNDIRGGTGDGIRVSTWISLGALEVADNTVTGVRGDGIVVGGSDASPPAPPGWPTPGPVTMRGNRAVANGGHGLVIEGTVAVVDGGGNMAAANRVSPQCVGLVCRGQGGANGRT
jgi:hypothetical protein